MASEWALAALSDCDVQLPIVADRNGCREKKYGMWLLRTVNSDASDERETLAIEDRCHLQVRYFLPKAALSNQQNRLD